MPRLWIDTAGSLTLSSGSGTAQISLMTDVTRQETRLAQMTLLRTIIGLNIGNTVHDSGEGSQLISIGIGVVSQEAFALGTTATPSPHLDNNFPPRGWVWRARYRTFGFAADQPTIFTQRIDLDMRSQRKLENGEAFLRGVNEDIEGVASQVTIHGLIRQLWLVG